LSAITWTFVQSMGGSVVLEGISRPLPTLSKRIISELVVKLAGAVRDIRLVYLLDQSFGFAEAVTIDFPDEMEL
jgi:hypothetical protein